MPAWADIKNAIGFIAAGAKTRAPFFSTIGRTGAAISMAHAGDRIALGALASGAINTAFGDKDTPITERFMHGAAIGAGIGLFITPAMYAAGVGVEGGVAAASRGVPWAGRRIGNAITRNAARWGADKRAWYSLGRAFDAFGTVGTLATLGAVGGGIYGATQGHPLRGALLGAGAGVGVRALAGIGRSYEGSTMFGRSAMIAGGTALAFGVSNALQSPDLSQSVALSPDAAGLPEYGPPGSGVQVRMEAMNASGDVVLGLHNSRRRR